MAHSNHPAVKVLFGVLILALTALLIRSYMARPAPRQAAPENGVPRRGGTVVIAASSDMAGVNQLINGSLISSRDVTERLFLPLLEEQTDYQDHPPTFKPRLAESYAWSEDHRLLTFHLRDDIYWSDGVPITAEDVRWTWQAQMHPDVAWDSRLMKQEIEDVEVVDAKTVRFHFRHAYPGQLVHANEGGILPMHAWSRLPFSEWRRNSAWFQENLVVSGPFTLESWEPQQQIVLKRNELYYEEGLPYLDRVIFRVIPDSASQLQQLLAGQVHFVTQLPAADARRVVEAPGARLESFWSLNFQAVIWNLTHSLFADSDVRHALTLAIDRQAIVDTLWYGHARPLASPILPSFWAHDPDLEPLPYDPREARRLLAAKGWEDRDGDGILERDGMRFSLDLATNAGNRERIAATVMIQDQLRRVGIEVQPRIFEFNSLHASLADRSFDGLLVGMTVETGLDFTSLLHSESIATEKNFGAFSNPEVDRVLEAIRGQRTLEDCLPLLHQLEWLIHREQPYTLLWQSRRLSGMSERLRGARPNSISSYINLQEWWLSSPD